MRLLRLRIQQFRQFRSPLEVDGLHAGINLFVGPNESGKSTLAHAIRAAFFERHNSSSLRHLQPWGDSGAAPEVDLDFSWNGQVWHLKKRFLKQARCDLRVGDETLSGREAEDRLAELLDYEFAAAGASKPQHHGIPGLLWVEQGTGQDLEQPITAASDHLHSALNDTLGQLASTGGDALTQRVEAARGKLLTPTGQPRTNGELKETMTRLEEAQQELATLEERTLGYQQQVDELGRLRRQVEADATRPWLEQRGKAETAQRELDRVAALQQEQQQATAALEHCEAEQTLLRLQLEDMAAQEQQLAQRAQELKTAQLALAKLREQEPALQQRLKEMQDLHRKAQAGLQQARLHERRRELQQRLESVATSLERLRDNLERALALQQRLVQQREELQQVSLDSASLQALEACEQSLGRITVQQEAVATRLRWELEPGRTLGLGTDPIQGQGERLLLEAVEISIPDVGRLQLQPGGQDLGQLRRERERLQGERDRLLRQLGVADLAQARQRAARQRELETAIAQDGTVLKTLAPQGVTELQAEQALAQRSHGELKQQIEALPQPPGGASASLTSAEDAEADAATQLRQAEQTLSDLRPTLALAQGRETSARQEWQQLQEQLVSPQRAGRQQEARQRLLELGTQEQQLRAAMQQRAEQIQAADPELLRQDVQRYRASADQAEAAAQGRAQATLELSTRLQTLGAEGLEERTAAQRQLVARLQRRQDELQLRADALSLLLELLQSRRQALVQRLQAPLRERLQHYLRLLFPGAGIRVDEGLTPVALERARGGTRELGSLDELSFGTREQMGLIARLAYADLLKEAGRPTLIILDDTLVHSDAGRLEQMKRILYDAASRHQILLLSCRPELWGDLGVAPVHMQELRSSAASIA